MTESNFAEEKENDDIFHTPSKPAKKKKEKAKTKKRKTQIHSIMNYYIF